MTTPPEGQPMTKEELQADIEATRANLGETVDSLTQKLDVKQRVKDSATETSHRAVEQVKAKPAVPLGLVAAVVVVVGLVVWRRRR